MPVSRSLWEHLTGSNSSSDKEKKKKEEKPKKERNEQEDEEYQSPLQKLNRALKTPKGGY